MISWHKEKLSRWSKLSEPLLSGDMPDIALRWHWSPCKGPLVSPPSQSCCAIWDSPKVLAPAQRTGGHHGEVGPLLKYILRSMQLHTFLDLGDCSVTHALITSQLDYFNAIYIRRSLKSIWWWYKMQNAAAQRVVGTWTALEISRLLDEIQGAGFHL